MNRSFYLLIISIIVYSCQNEDATMLDIKQEIKQKSQALKINENDALSIADMVLDRKSDSRHGSNNPKFDYVLSSDQISSRTNNQDTLAYIINYPNDNGFVIVSSSKHVYPVLAFSDKGYFCLENEISKTYFINNIESYISEASSDSVFEVGENDFVNCAGVSPIVKTALHQGFPWNKYVIIEHPNCPVGCLAVATANVMIHSKYEMNYHNSRFALKSIVDALNQESSNTINSINNNKRIIGDNDDPGVPPLLPKYTYEEAVDSLAKILYWIGKDVKMLYSEKESSASFSYAYTLLKTMSFNILSYRSYENIDTVIDFIMDNNIILIYGRDYETEEGHAWVIDGCTYCIDPDDNSSYKNAYVHCDWGWGGSSNGYFAGNVFSVNKNNFYLKSYIVVKRAWK